LSRSEGSEPPYPPITVPLARNIKVTAIAAVRPESWLVTVAVAIIQVFCIDLVESPTLRMMACSGKADQLRKKRTCTSVPDAIHTLQHLYRVGGARARAFLRAPLVRTPAVTRWELTPRADDVMRTLGSVQPTGADPRVGQVWGEDISIRNQRPAGGLGDGRIGRATHSPVGLSAGPA
jgi:hypothetical protein